MNQLAQKRENAFSRALIRWLAVALWAGLIFFFSSRHSLSTGLGMWDTVLRKAGHMAEFGVLSLLVWLAVRQHAVTARTALGVAALTSFLYAISDEVHQRYVPGRTASIRDVGFDTAGIVIALTAALIYKKLVRQGDQAGKREAVSDAEK